MIASDVLGRIKRKESEQAIMRLLPVEQDLGIATNLSFGLCLLFSKEGIPQVIQQIEKGYDSMMLDLEESLYINCTMNEEALPELINRSTKNERVSVNGYGFPVQKPHVKTENIGRNDPCPCGSGKKYKKCCG